MNDIKSLFNIQVDETVQYNLKEAAKWARFLSVIGIVFTLLFMLIGIGLTVVSMMNFGGVKIPFVFGLVYFVISAVSLYPLITFYKFGKDMKTALLNNSQEAFSTSIQNLKSCLKFVGILTAITVLIYVVTFIVLIIANGMDFLK